MRSRALVIGFAIVGGCVAPDHVGRGHPVFELEEVSRLGTLEGDGSALSSVSGIAATDSTILVLEAAPPRVAVFRPSGEWISDFGRSGDGPGELRRPGEIGLVGGEVWIGDAGGRRLEVFRMDGGSIRSYRWELPPDSLGAPAFAMAQLSDGSILAGPGNLSLGAVVQGVVKHRSYYRATTEGVPLGEVYREVLSPSDFVQGDLPGGGMFVGVHPIRESPLVAVYPDGSGLVAVERLAARSRAEEAFRVRVFGAEGHLETDVEVPYEPLPAEGWRERFAAELENGMLEQTGTVDRPTLEAYREAPAERAYYPPVTRVLAGADGSIWIRREEVKADSVRWQVLGRDGDLLGGLSTRSGLDIHSASVDEVWAVEHNELDVPFVVRMRVVR